MPQTRPFHTFLTHLDRSTDGLLGLAIMRGESGHASSKKMDMTKRSRSCDVVWFGLAAGVLMVLGSATSAVAGDATANTFFSGWHATVVGVLIPLAAAGVAIGFIARAVSNARDGASPVGAVVGALVTAGGAMLLPTIAVLSAAGSSFGPMEIRWSVGGFEPSLLYAYVLIRWAKDRFLSRAISSETL